MRLPLSQFDAYARTVYGLGGLIIGFVAIAVYSASANRNSMNAVDGSSRLSENVNAVRNSVFSRPIIDQSTENVYAFDERANKLLRILFPGAVRPAAVNKALVGSKSSLPMSSLDDVLNWTLDGNFVACDGPASFRVGNDQMDSYWLSIHSLNTPRRADALLDLAVTEDFGDLIRGLQNSELSFVSLIERALFQRDVYQAFSIFYKATQITSSAELRSVGRGLLSDLAGLFHRLRFSQRDYESLLDLRPTVISREYFENVNHFRLEDDYLPTQVLGSEDGWFRLDGGLNTTRHFRHYSGRSFVRVYVRPRYMSREEFGEYFDGLRKTYGTDLMVSSDAPPLPAGSETLLVRSFGLFLEDGTYADTGFPEEVLMRIFKYEKHTFDLASSDHRGTMFYQYKLKRQRLIADPASLGLQRIHDDDPQFMGFFSEVPDPFNATSEAIGTMRFNCMGCHSETLYGVSTVFSLSIEPAEVGDELETESEILVPTDREGFYRLKSSENEELCQLLNR